MCHGKAFDRRRDLCVSSYGIVLVALVTPAGRGVHVLLTLLIRTTGRGIARGIGPEASSMAASVDPAGRDVHMLRSTI